MRTNVSRGAGGANPTLSGTTSGYPNAAATDGTQRAFTETLLKSAIAQAWNAGGEPTMVFMSLFNKMSAAAFGGLAQQRRETGDKKLRIIAGADIYVSDVGELQFIPSRFGSNRDALIIDPQLWAVSTLDPMQRERMGKTGLSDKDLMWCEKTLKCRNEAGNALVADLTTA